jgi:hypothetical protein
VDGTPPRVELAENWLVQQNSRQLSCAWLFHRTLLRFLVRPKHLPGRPHLPALDVTHADRPTIAHPVLALAIPTVAGSDARERRRRALPLVSRHPHTGH